MRTYRNLMARIGGALLLAGVFVITSTANAEAAFMLRLTEGATSVTITDQGAGDANPSVGQITFIGAVGSFTANVSTGFSKPLLPSSPTYAEMDLNSVNTSNTPSTLAIELTDTDFPATTGPGTLHALVGGTSQGEVAFAAFKNSSNVEFDIDNADAEVILGPFGVGAFGADGSDAHGPIGTYSMTLVAVITHGEGVNTSSFDFNSQNVSVPEPASLALFGIGLLGAGMAARRRKANRS